MKKIVTCSLLIFCICAIKLTAQEQPVSDLVFNKLVHDFGDFLLSDGKLSCTFTYTNKGSKPIVIQTIIASCGCTEPKWDKAPILPGKSGSISVTYLNDQGPYPFDKTIAIYSTASDRPITLRIRGVVHEKKRTVSELFPVTYGPFRLRNAQYHLGQISQGEAKTDSAQVVNDGKSTIEIGFTNVSKGLNISVNPKKLKSGERGYIRYTVDTKQFIDWGTITYTAQPLVNGKREGANPIEIIADIRDNFKNYTREQLADAPILLAEQTSVRVENAKQGSKIEKSFSISNKGKSPLLLHKASAPNDYTTVVNMPKEIAPGKSANVTIAVNTAKLNGEFVTGITIITNVPSRPAFSLMVTGTVVP